MLLPEFVSFVKALVTYWYIACLAIKLQRFLCGSSFFHHPMALFKAFLIFFRAVIRDEWEFQLILTAVTLTWCNVCDDPSCTGDHISASPANIIAAPWSLNVRSMLPCLVTINKIKCEILYSFPILDMSLFRWHIMNGIVCNSLDIITVTIIKCDSCE